MRGGRGPDTVASLRQQQQPQRPLRLLLLRDVGEGFGERETLLRLPQPRTGFRSSSRSSNSCINSSSNISISMIVFCVRDRP